MAVTMLLAGTAFMLSPAQAQTFTVIHAFTGGADGGRPLTGLVDAGGNFYGVSPTGGQRSQNCQVLQCGLVWKISQHSSSWVLTPLHDFAGGDGSSPNADLVFGPDGALYGTTVLGGSGNATTCTGCGTVFKLQPPPTRCSSTLCPWRETVLYNFPGGPGDGYEPSAGVTFDSAGNIYGPTTLGGSISRGVLYKLTYTNGNWIESVPYEFGAESGGRPHTGDANSSVRFDPAGNLFGAEVAGGTYGSIYKLSPSGSGFTGEVIHSFMRSSDGEYPVGVLLYQGSVYGITTGGGDNGGGFVYQLSLSSGQWILNVLQNFSGPARELLLGSPMVVDAQGNLYGASPNGGQFSAGAVFKLSFNGGGWTYTSLYDFTGGDDGASPNSVVIDVQGNVYGTTFGGGAFDMGVAFKITP